MTKFSNRELEVLSAYLDGEVSDKNRVQIETRLKEEPELREMLEQLQHTRSLVRALPMIRAPRNYFLTPEMVGQSDRPRQLFPIFRFASALAAVMLVLILFGDFYLLRSQPLPAPVAMQAMEFDEAAADQVEATPILESEFIESQAPQAPMPEAEEMPVEEAAPAEEPVLGEAELAERSAEMEKAITTVMPTLEFALEDAAEGSTQIHDESLPPAEPYAAPPQEESEPALIEDEIQQPFQFTPLFRIAEVVLFLVLFSTGGAALLLYLREKKTRDTPIDNN